MTLYLANVKLKKQFLKNIGIILGILLMVYSVILLLQPNDFIVYTKTTIQDINNTKTK